MASIEVLQNQSGLHTTVFFLDRPIAFESLVCQLPQIVSQLSWHPFLSAFSPLRSKIGLDLNPIFWLTILDATSSSGARPRLGFQATARVNVHLCRRPHLAFESLEDSPQPERPWLTRCGGRLCCAPERVRWDLRR